MSNHLKSEHQCPSRHCRGQSFVVRGVGAVCSLKLDQLGGWPYTERERLMEPAERPVVIPHAQDAETGPRVLIAAIHPDTGRQVVNLLPSAILPPLIELRHDGFHWHDVEGHQWDRIGEMTWGHSSECLCFGVRPFRLTAK